MIDTHTHLYMDAYTAEEGLECVDHAVKEGVEIMVFAGVSPESNEAMFALNDARKENTRIAIGLHPTEVSADYDSVLDMTEHLLDEKDVVAVGETGIDLYWEQDKLEFQKRAFERQIKMAQSRNLALIIHCRNGFDETIEVLKRCQEESPLPRMVFHSFTATAEEVRKIREICDPYFGINGVVTFKNAQSLRDALLEIGIERIVLETDAPYLAPVPHRGKRNESSLLPLIKDEVARVLELGYEETEQITDENARNLYGL